jgi:hypothetical protein
MPKSVAEAIAAGVPALGNIRDTLVKSREALINAAKSYPDLAPSVEKALAEIDAKIAVLDGVMNADYLAALGLTVLRELAALPSTGLSPTFHPGSVTGG